MQINKSIIDKNTKICYIYNIKISNEVFTNVQIYELELKVADVKMKER